MARLSLPHPKTIVRTLLFALLVFGVGPRSLQPFSPSDARAAHCGSQATCNLGGGNHICEGECKSYLTCASDGTLKQIPGSCGYQGASLTITNVSHGSPLSDQATITWTTNLAATHVVKYGLSASALTSQQVNTLPMSTSHSVRLLQLQPATTYYYQAYSETGPDPDAQRASSSTRSFTTAAGVPSGSGPSITFGPRADATDAYADITFRTDVPTAALVEYDRQNNTNVDPTSPTYAQACSPAASACPPPAVPPAGTTATDHTVRVTNFVQPSQSQKFYYRVTITDGNGNALTTAEFFFNTSGSSDDHVFTTGGCSDGNNQIPIGQCSADGRYCRTGGQLAYDCRPGINCTTACPAGSTCLANGDCSADPALTGSPTECNPKFCYQKCDGNSGAKSGLPCTADSDCTIGNFVGSCTLGSFDNPAVPGCRASWPGCDANIILKVRPDRVCDKWLYCNTSVETTNAFGKKENQCFDLAICDSLGLGGYCNDKLEGGQCENDPLRFCNRDADCQGLGKCKLQSSADNIPITYKTPQDVDKIKNLSGYAYAGLDWWEQPGSPPPIEGYYPLSFAKQVGQPLDVQDGDFEDTVIQARCSNDKDVDCTNGGDSVCQNTDPKATCSYQVVRDPLVASLWEGISPTGSANPATASVTVEKEGGASNPNYFLRVVPTDKAGSGAWTSRAMNLRPTGGADYILTVRMRSEQDERPYQVSLVNEAGQETVLDENPGDNVSSPVELASEWKSFRLGPAKAGGGLSRLAFKTTVTGTSVTFDVDDIAFFPALQVNDTTRLAQDCRLYPNENAAKCQFLDQNGVLYQGLKGYCLERDPQNSAVCLSWWPVDIVSGSNIFEQETGVGYSDRRPLYACAEAEQYSEIIYANGFGGDPNQKTEPRRPITTQREIQLGDIDKFIVQFAPQTYNGGNDWGAIPQDCDGNSDRLPVGNGATDDNARAWRINDQAGFLNPGTAYYAEVYPSLQTDGGTSIATLRLVEQDDQGTDVCVAGFSGWPRSWADWMSEPANIDDNDHLKNGFGVRVWSDGSSLNSKMSSIDVKAIDDSVGSFMPLFRVSVVLKPSCKKLVEVASTTEDSAWADRTAASSTYVVPDLNFRYITDLAPFAGVVNPNVLRPSQWPLTNGLTVEGPDLRRDPPQYQSRGGKPFACNSPISGLGAGRPDACGRTYCDGDSGNLLGNPCNDSNDCNDTQNSKQGKCVGTSICLKYIASDKRYDFGGSTKRPCVATSGCPQGEECVGAYGQPDPAQVFDNTAASDSAHFSQNRIQRLFAEAFSIWEWDSTQRKYVDSTNQAGLSPWTPPATLCKVCSGGSADGQACTSSAACGAGGTCIDADIHPKSYAGSETAADYCAIRPKITNVFDVDKQFVPIDEGNPYTLRFNSKVDPEQLPLTRVIIDWGDGSTPTVDPVRINDRQSKSKPHPYSHPYGCQLDPNTGDCKQYEIRLQIQDNWGWCDNGASQAVCPSETDAAHPWTKGPTIQVKRN